MEKNRQLEHINRQINKVVDNFQKMTEVVSFHDEMLSDIENNSMQSVENMRKGKEFLV